MKRKKRLETKEYDSNPLLQWGKERDFLRVTFNTIFLSIAKFLPLKLKNKVYRSLGVTIGDETAVALGVMLDIFYPEKIQIGSNTTIGYGTTVLTHETTTDEFRTGPTKIGDNVLIGAQTVILPGVEIGDGAKISANSVVHRDIEEGEFVGGNPLKKIDSNNSRQSL
jgi:acetyltransferase-like isoleucine patch superfamily enzyme